MKIVCITNNSSFDVRRFYKLCYGIINQTLLSSATLILIVSQHHLLKVHILVLVEHCVYHVRCQLAFQAEVRVDLLYPALKLYR